MAEIEVEYLVVGAGASGMAFVDALVTEDREAEVLIVDRRHRPGGHWHDAYPFVRLHQPSATYGVNSLRLGAGILEFANAGMRGLGARSMDREISAWTEICRLNPARGANAHLDDPRIADAASVISSNLFPALENLSRLVTPG